MTSPISMPMPIPLKKPKTIPTPTSTTQNRFLNRIDPCHKQLDANPQSLVQEIWDQKYRHDNEPTFSATFARVARAIYEYDAPEHMQEAYEAMDAGLWMPGGRIIAGAGTSKRVTLMNCLHGDTEFMTPTGLRRLRDVKHKHAEVWTRKGWKQAEIRYFGVQPTNTVTLRARHNSQLIHQLRVTPDHRWFINTGEIAPRWCPAISETDNLHVGDWIVASRCEVTRQNSTEYDLGFVHGMVFGDGHLKYRTQRAVSGGHPVGTYHHTLRLCGKKQQHLPRFSAYPTTYPPSCKGEPVVSIDEFVSFKEIPTTYEPDYVAGFIDGWHATDGHLENGETQKVIESTNLEAIEWLVSNAPYGGYFATGKKLLVKAGTKRNEGFGTLKSDLWGVTIKEDRVCWKVTDITPSEPCEVFCAVVPSEQEFTLAGGILTRNCYVNKKLEDSLDDIMQGVSIAALTQQQGGGIGTDFSPLRPQGAILHRTGAKASGPLPFMDMWHSMCSTIMSAGDRRGAMMGTICDTHPDLPAFITAKQTKNRLTNFNVSVLVSDALMGAVADDEDWMLYFNIPPKDTRPQDITELDFFDEDDNTQQYVYSVWRARDLWDLITKNTYDWSEPGIIFIDRINEANNLKYVEHIHCTNPCGEQPLPPNGTCNLGAINLSRCVSNPFRPNASLNLSLIEEISRIGTRFLDNVIDITQYPLPEQQQEEADKRRLGLGVSGLADCLAQLNLRYGSAQATATTERIFQTICLSAYEASTILSKERGAFPLFDPQKYLEPNSFASNLPTDLQERIKLDGIRNGVLLTVAPTGTTSILYGNISSGIEPVFAHKADRKVRQADNSFKTHSSYGYNIQLYSLIANKAIGTFDMPTSAVEAHELRIEDHIVTQAAVQRWVDASVSKTVNISEDTSYEQFQKVYDLAYSLGCKGCTTYRPSEVRGSILSRANGVEKPKLAERSEVLSGTTHKVKWPSMSSALYVTVNRDPDSKPFEVFFHSKDARSQEWMVALSLMISAILRKSDGDVGFIAEELGAVHSTHDTAWIKLAGKEKPKFFGSLIAYIGYILGQDFHLPNSPGKMQTQTQTAPEIMERCPQCLATNSLEYKEGCLSCFNCGFSNCG